MGVLWRHTRRLGILWRRRHLLWLGKHLSLWQCLPILRQLCCPRVLVLSRRSLKLAVGGIRDVNSSRQPVPYMGLVATDDEECKVCCPDPTGVRDGQKKSAMHSDGTYNTRLETAAMPRPLPAISSASCKSEFDMPAAL